MCSYTGLAVGLRRSSSCGATETSDLVTLEIGANDICVLPKTKNGCTNAAEEQATFTMVGRNVRRDPVGDPQQGALSRAIGDRQLLLARLQQRLSHTGVSGLNSPGHGWQAVPGLDSPTAMGSSTRGSPLGRRSMHGRTVHAAGYWRVRRSSELRRPVTARAGGGEGSSALTAWAGGGLDGALSLRAVA